MLRSRPAPTAIASLVQPARPSAVVRGIWTVIVDALNRKAIRPRPHVLKKRGGTFKPAVAHINAPTAIAGIIGTALVIAAVLGFVISPQLWTDSPIPCGAMARPSPTRSVISAAATCSVAGSQVAGIDHDHLSALTAAVPSSFGARFASEAQHGEPTVFVPYEIKRFHGLTLLLLARLGKLADAITAAANASPAAPPSEPDVILEPGETAQAAEKPKT